MIVVPIVMQLINPESVVDVGCGIGTWLSVFKKNGVRKIVGIDGSHVDREQLLFHIDEEEFMIRDLIEPLAVKQKFDLVVSLEVAEHLPEKVSDTFVKSLTQLGDHILFSAAIPHQGGDGHINEQWPLYWKTKFNLLDFEVYDCIRPRIWESLDVNWWYKQNIFMAVNRDSKLLLDGKDEVRSLVHPESYMHKVKQISKLKNKKAQSLPSILQTSRFAHLF